MLLPIAQFTYNTIITETIKVSSFYANYGYNPEMAKHGTTAVRAQRAGILVEQLIILHKKLSMNLQFISFRAKRYYDRDRSEEINFKMGDKAYVLRRNMKTTKKSNKLNHVKIGLFKILRNIKNINYELELSNTMKRKHPVFHVSLLKSAHSETSNIIVSKKYIESDEKYEIESILNKQLIDEKFYYLMK